MRSRRRVAVVLVVVVAAVVAGGGSAFASGGRQAQRVAVSGVEVVSGPGAGELSVTWDAHGVDPVDYRVTWTLGGEPFTRHSVADANAFPTGTEHLISGLEPGEVYDVKVRARFDARRSRWSDVVSGAAAAHPPPAQDLAVPQSISAPTPEEPLDYARGHDDPMLSISDAEHFEAGFLGVTFTVEFSAVSSHDVSVTYSTSIEFGDTAEVDDFVAATGTITALAGIDFIQFSVALNDDDVYEGDETFTVTLSDAVNATLPLPATATGTIHDNESEPTISIADASADEGDDLMFEATLSVPADRVVSFSYSTSIESGDTADPLNDFLPRTAVRTGFGAGETVVTVPVSSIDEPFIPVFEDDETFTVTISNPSPYGTIGRGSAKGTIFDNEPVPTASMVRASYRASENGGRLSDVVVIELSPVADRPLDVTLVTSGTAEPGQFKDYLALPATVRFPSNSLQERLDVSIVDDFVYERQETIDIAMVAVGSDITVDPNAAEMQIIIVDNDAAPRLSVRGGTGTEGGQNHGTSPVAGQDFANVVFELELSGVMIYDFTVQYETVDGTARAGADYEPVAGTATIPMGQTSALVLVPVVDDGDFEGANAETVGLRLFNASDPALGFSPFGRGFIADNEELPEGADYVGQTVDTEGSVAVGESWYHGRTAVNGRIEYRINARRDVDWYQVDLAGGSCYEIDVRGATTWQRYLDGDFPAQYAPTGPLTLAHPFIEGLYDADGDYVEGTQDKGYLGYPESTVTLRPRQGGTYYIAVTNRIPFESGTFDLSVIDLGSATLTCTNID